MKKKGITDAPLSETYREESTKPAVIIMIAAVLLVGTPLALANKRIEDDGQRAADVSRFAQLANKLTDSVTLVFNTHKKATVSDSTLKDNGMLGRKGPTLITPDIKPTEMNESRDPNALDLKVSAIYWNPHSPLVTIDGENYREGQKVKGFTILKIGKTEVLFRNPAGENVKKNFYDYLD